MESVPWRQRGTYVGRWLWLLGASDTREGVGVTVLHEEGGEVEAEERGLLSRAHKIQFDQRKDSQVWYFVSLTTGTIEPGLPPFPWGN